LENKFLGAGIKRGLSIFDGSEGAKTIDKGKRYDAVRNFRS
jgi:hypothetical protein